ncbi:ABC transporter ATP-binding protein [Variovorax rhizosphaerae]|uniref:ABC transporter ATP-binding protein n=1 Tax=Variovorax rhizosphaerae TaxID=1836200 RepID=A0ABU8WJP7_9BURK
MATFQSLQLDRVALRFGGFKALDDFSLTIKAGEFVSLLGPSGCGKSTALNCLSGLLQISSGSITLDDKRIDVLPPERRGFGMVFQNYALFPHLSVRRNVAFGLEMRKVPKAEVDQRVERALATVRLANQIDKLPGQLSGGQQQRVAIARAVAIEPPLVLMDEPLSNLDAKLRLELRHEIKRLHHALGLTTIYVTHDQDEALSLSDRIVVMRDGRIQQQGTPETLYNAPDNLYVARFMGYRNAFPVRMEGRAALVGEGIGAMRFDGLAMPPGGMASSLAFRPDDVKLSNDGIPAEVAQVEYCGQLWLVDLRTADGTHVTMETHERVTMGERVQFRVAPDRIRLFADAYVPEAG